MRRSCTPILLALAMACPARAQLDLPAPVGYVNDFANVIPPAQEEEIRRLIEQVRAQSGGVIVVVTLQSLQGRSRDEVALQIGREWKVGEDGEPGGPARGTGSVVLVVPGERQAKIELGSRTNTFITAAEAGRVLNTMRPYFRSGEYGTGIQLGVREMASHYADHFGFSLGGAPRAAAAPAAAPAPEVPQGDGFPWLLVLGFLVAGVVMAVVLSDTEPRPARRRGRPSGTADPVRGDPLDHPYPATNDSHAVVVPMNLDALATGHRPLVGDDEPWRFDSTLSSTLDSTPDSGSDSFDLGGGGDFDGGGAGGEW